MYLFRRRAAVLALGFVAGLLALGCERKDAGPAKPAQPATPAPDSGDMDALISLPYTGAVETDDDEAGVVFRDETRSCPGYNLYAIQMHSMAVLMDEEGQVVRTWRYTPSPRWERATLLPDGDLLVVGADPYAWTDGGPPFRIHDDSRYVLRFDWYGKLLWKKYLTAHHDIELTPAGKLLTLSFTRRVLPEVHPQIPVRDDLLTLLEPDGKISASRSMLEAVQRKPDVFPLRPVKPTTLGGPPWLDFFHSNSCEWMHQPELVGRHPLYDLGNILVCFRHQNRVAVFNWERNEIVWAWGQSELSGPHDAQVLPSGNILIFDNGLVRDWSRVIEVDPLTGRIVWEFKADPPTALYTRSKGSAQRLPNGNTLIAESDKGRAFEVTPAGEVVWEFLCPERAGPRARAAIIRMVRYPRELIERIQREKGS